MKYAELVPAAQLSAFIDTFWILKTDSLVKTAQRRIFADGCMEFFINIGSSTPMVNGQTPLLPGRVYLGGTMTGSHLVSSHPNSTFVGIRFRPGGFSAFYIFSVEELVNRLIEFPESELFSIIGLDEGLHDRLNRFFLGRLRPSPTSLIPLINTITHHKGLVSVDFLAQEHSLTTRTMERSFKREIGIAPKALINIIKFTHVTRRILINNGKESLLRIAHEQGYYDHAHLTKEIKRYSGLAPSQFGITDWGLNSSPADSI